MELAITNNTLKKTNISIMLVIIILVFEFLTFYTNRFLITENVIRLNYQFMDNEMVDKLILVRSKFSFLSYIIIPLIILFRCILFSAPVYARGLIIEEFKIGFSDLFKIALWGELIFICYSTLKILMLVFTTDSHIIANVSLFSPLSVSSLLNYLQLKTDPFTYLFQVFNVFELLFWIVATSSISLIKLKSSVSSLIHISLSYGVALLIWSSLVIFLQTMFS